MSPRKDPHAIALGRKGGAANTPAQLAARRRNALKGGRKPEYAVSEHGALLRLTRRVGDDWTQVNAFHPATLRYLATWLSTNKRRTAVVCIDGDGTIHYRKE